METFTRWVYYFLESLGLDLSYMTNLNRLIVLVLIAVLAFLTDWICRKGIVRLVRKVTQKTKVTWDDLLFNDRVMNNFCHILPPVVVYILLPIAFPDGSDALAFIRKLCMVYIIAAALRFINIFLGVIFQLATQKEVFRDRPLKGVYQIIQVALFFVGSICIIAVLIEKSPIHLLAGLGASAAILMLVFKDSILGFVAGIQLSANDMVRPGDWVTLPSGDANGIVQEITLNTVKIQNFDNTISTIPPYTLVSSPFQNWRGMTQSGGRRVMKSITLDLTTLQFCTPEMLDRYRKEIPLMADYQPEEGVVPTNSQVYRVYIERYLCSLPVVNQELDLIISQKEATMYGVPIQVYFFSRNKVWKEYERIQSDIFDHLLAMVPKFDLKVYQYSD